MTKKSLFVYRVFLFFLFLTIPALSLAAPVGKITKLEGKVDVMKAGTRTVSMVSLGDTVDVGDIFRAKTNSRAEITFFNNNILRIHPATRVQVSQYTDDGTRSNQVMKLDRGKVEAVSGKEFIKQVSSFAEGNKFEVHTPNAVAGIRGSGMTTGFAQMITGLFFGTGHGYFYNPNQRGVVQNVSAGFVSFIVGVGGMPSRPVPGNASYVGGGSGGGSLPGGGTGTGGTGTNLIQTVDLINPISQTYTFTPPPTIPNVIVGTVDSMSGSLGGADFGFNVSISGIKFYGPSTTAAPQSWQADKVSGNYWNFDPGPLTFVIPVSGGGLSAYASITGSDTDYTGTWAAQISNGNAPNGVGSYRQPFTFSGTAAGTWANSFPGTGTITGTASGVVPGVLTQDPIATPAVNVGYIPMISGSVGATDWVMVEFSNVKFWGPGAGRQPYSWTATSVAGSYGGNPAVVAGIPFSVTGAGGVQANMVLNSAAAGSWNGTISNGYAPAGTLQGAGAFPLPTAFNGTASGNYSGGVLTNGKAAGPAHAPGP